MFWGREQAIGDSLLSSRKKGSGVAATGVLRVRVGAEGAQLRGRVGHADHCKGTRLVLSVERSEFGRIVRRKTAGGGILRIVEPEAQMKRVGGRQSCIRIKAEDLVEQNRLDADVTFVAVFADLNVGLIPRQTEAAFEGRVGHAFRQERAALDGKKIEGKSGFEAVEVQKQGVIQLAADDRRMGPGFLVGGFAKTVDKLWIWHQIKTDFIFLVLSCGFAGEENSSDSRR